MAFRIIDSGPGCNIDNEIVARHDRKTCLRIDYVHLIAVDSCHLVSPWSLAQGGDQILAEHPGGANNQPAAHGLGSNVRVRMPRGYPEDAVSTGQTALKPGSTLASPP